VTSFTVWPAEEDGCFAASVSTCVQLPPDELPRPDWDRADWLQAFNAQLERRAGVRLVRVGLERLPPYDESERWVCGLQTGEPDIYHAIAAIGSRILHDPNGRWAQGLIPWSIVHCGFRLVPV
jgi:hypothetical protein